MPKTAKQNQEIQELSRAKIVETALLLFAQHGYESTTTRQIAEHAGISYGLMYHYFKSKEDLLKLVFQRCIEPLQQMILSLDETASPEKRLEYLVRKTFSIAEADPSLAGLFYTLRSQASFMSLLRAETMQSINALRSIFEQAFREIPVAEGAKHEETPAVVRLPDHHGSA